MLKILVFGPEPPCKKCTEAYETALKAAEEFADRVEVKKLDAMSPEGDEFGVMLTPTVVVGDTVIAAGKVPKADRIREFITRQLG